ncbi:MAG TPA: dihydrolipoamide acetyltransferase, partial [Thermoanaerobaculia bacterium]|nr:dihydrolipoamide acetyltransferase [Thermoanaerobaculia bacterium]
GLTGGGALDGQLAGDPAARAMSIALLPRIEEPVVAQATPPAPSEAAPRAAAPVAAAPAATSSEPVVVARHEAAG